MKSISNFILCALLITILGGCASAWQQLRNSTTSPAVKYREKARNLEDQNKLPQALLAWRIVYQLEKEDAEAGKAIRRLVDQSNKLARKHYQKGLKHYKSGEYRQALRQFLITIRYNPHHKKARYYLKTRLQNTEQNTYQVQPGDSFIRIASNIYKDPSKAHLLAYFNGLNPRKPLLIGTTLLLPVFEDHYIHPRSNIASLLDQAQKAYAAKRYPKVYAAIRKIQNEIPGHPQARRLADAAHFDEGKILLERKHFLAAVKQFEQVSPGYKGRKQALDEARSQIKQSAVEEKLAQAQKHLRNNKWKRVIKLTEEIMDQAPDNTQAKMLFSNASYNLGKALLDRGDTVEAVELLARIDPSYEDTGQLLALARSKMRSQADTYYRDGVKHFINEDLKSAIKAWKKALQLNPDHPKAKQDIKNAERLLEKLRALESPKKEKP